MNPFSLNYFRYMVHFDSIKGVSTSSFWALIGALSLVLLYFFYQVYKHIVTARILGDTPTAKIRSAAQGYVELKGVQHYKNQPILAPLSRLPCTWYYYTISHYENRKWVRISEGISTNEFELHDGTGVCIIQPQGARMTPSIKDSWMGFVRQPNGKPKHWYSQLWGSLGRYQYTEWRMQEGEALYACGYFYTTHDIEHPVNILSGKGATQRTPFILSSKDEKSTIWQAKRDAFIWFVAYLLLLIGTGWLIAVRFG